MKPGYGNSYTVWCSPTPGTTLWPFQFVDDYIDVLFVKVRYKDFSGNWVPVKINYRTAFSGHPNVVEITPAIPPCAMVEIYRDTPKDTPIVVYGHGGMVLLDESRNAAARQSVHVIAELKEFANRTDLECLCECVEATT